MKETRAYEVKWGRYRNNRLESVSNECKCAAARGKSLIENVGRALSRE